MISGGAIGIGRTTARLFAERGAQLAVLDIREEDGRRCVEELKTKGAQARFYPCNLTVRADVEKAVEGILRDFGKLDALANIAGGSKLQPFWEFTEADWDAQINLNLKSAFLCCRAVVGHMRERWSGAIVNLSSVFLASPMARHMTGQTIFVNGGNFMP
jgi:NAD(P)-dependent dehydrogenase (short-subunit alcohol dehydrogenase family)